MEGRGRGEAGCPWLKGHGSIKAQTRRTETPTGSPCPLLKGRGYTVSRASLNHVAMGGAEAHSPPQTVDCDNSNDMLKKAGRSRPGLFKTAYRPQRQFHPLRQSTESHSKRYFGPLGLQDQDLVIHAHNSCLCPTRATENNSHRPTSCDPLSAPAHTPTQLQPQLPLQTYHHCRRMLGPPGFPQGAFRRRHTIQQYEHDAVLPA